MYAPFDFCDLCRGIFQPSYNEVRLISSKLTFRYLKNYLQKRLGRNWPTLVPDILIVVITSTCTNPFYLINVVLTWYFNWDKLGVHIIGVIGGTPHLQFPMPIKEVLNGKIDVGSLISSAIVIAIIGYFETMIAVKHIANTDQVVSKPNRELVAMGAVNAAVCTSTILLH
jgi:MFS superfamily sulfate permease-like transporter